MRSSSQVFRIVLGLVLLCSPARLAAREEEPYPIRGNAPREEIGGLVSIPGSPLPAVPKESVEDAIRIYEPLVGGLRLVLGDDPVVARGLGYLAGLYAAVGNAAKAESLYGEALKLLEKKGSSGRDLGWVHNNQGLTRLDRKKYAEAMKSFHAAAGALASEPQLLEPRAITLQNLASAYHLLGEVERSESAYLEALTLLRRLKNEQTREYQKTSQNLAELYSTIGDFAAARKILEDLVARGGIRGSVLRFVILNNLGVALRKLKDYEAAEKRLREALALTAEGSRERALVLTNLAVTHFAAGDFEKGEREGEEALRLAKSLHGPESSSASIVEATLGSLALGRGDLPKAESLLTRSKARLLKGSQEEDVLAELNQSLAIVAQRRGEHERALDLSRQALDLEIRKLDRILAFGSEAQRLAYQSNAFPYDQLANLGDATLLAEAVLRTKGAVLESLLAERVLARRSTNPADRERIDRIHILKVAVMEQIAQDGRRLEEVERALKQEETALAKSLGRPHGTERPSADLARVQASLAPDQVLVEWIRFQRYEDGGALVPHYGAVLLPARGNPAWIVLGRADHLETSIESLVRRMEAAGQPKRGTELLSQEGGAPLPQEKEQREEKEVAAALRELHGLLWKPLEKAFPACARKVLLSPDGALHFVPWAALLDENERFVVERWKISHVGSGRDLVRPASGSPDKTLLALADGKGDLLFSPIEAEGIARIASEKGWKTTVLLDSQASEAELFRRKSPRILHLATHGILLDGELANRVESRLSRRPMYRGYLVLGGAEESLADWNRGSIPPFSNDGILTAEEAGGLDLSQTWLTVLSACRTGAGDARSGEGVLGLRRGFALAGTEHLLFTLWSVNDAATADFMELFYAKLFQTADPVSAFHETQVAELLRLKRASNLKDAVFRAGGFALTR